MLWVVVALAGALAAGAAEAAPAKSGPVIRDCRDCPAMVSLPGGTFQMGSPADEPGRHRNESPQRAVTLPAFAIGATEITRRQYEAFVRATTRAATGGCHVHGGGDDISVANPNASYRAPGFAQTPDHPAVCVSLIDAEAYAAWLSTKTGRAYRLPSEAEWEYAARAGTTSAFFWGASGDDCAHMNGGDETLGRVYPAWSKVLAAARAKGEAGSRLVACEDGAGFTAPVGRYRPNGFGLKDITGNVWEWTLDCYQASYEATPTDGRPYVGGECKERRTRGGSWDDYPDDLRVAVRKRLAPDVRRSDVGFRLVRETK